MRTVGDGSGLWPMAGQMGLACSSTFTSVFKAIGKLRLRHTVTCLYDIPSVMGPESLSLRLASFFLS